MERELVGYYIGENIQLDIAYRKVAKYDPFGRPQNFFILRDTMMRLFLYLLQNACDRIVTNEEILYHVWDLHGLKSSSQRLCQVMQTLRFRLAMLGVPHDFIMRIKTSEVKGYSIKKNMVRPLFLLTEEA
ncbi:hypothetical protein [Mixta calida]|uniref:hypothetical protein n=1 Tax=Mixta calida TaxID=665913 RepID=UPI0028A0E950|nr:hypothetical protein [Mixta calida]MDU4290510.1 hypothetical protein [Mixta calida]